MFKYLMMSQKISKNFSTSVCHQSCFLTDQHSVFCVQSNLKFPAIQLTFTLQNIKTKTCSAPTELSYAMRPETKQSRFETHLGSDATTQANSSNLHYLHVILQFNVS